MGFHICIVGYLFKIPVLLFWELHLMISFLFILIPISTNPTLLYVKPINAAASRASSSHLGFIITLAQSVSFTRGELGVS